MPPAAQTAFIARLKGLGVPVRKIIAATGVTQYRVFVTPAEE